MVAAYLAIFGAFNNASVKYDPLLIHQSAAIKSNYKGPILYKYKSGIGERITSVGYMAYLEIINTSDINTRINSYAMEFKIADAWIMIPHLSISDPLNVFWANNSNIKDCSRLDFRDKLLEDKLRNIELSPNQSIHGWVFFEWPKTLREAVPHEEGIRYTFENNREDIVIQEISTEKTTNLAASLDGGYWDFYDNNRVDLSKYKYLPVIDLLEYYENKK